MNASSTLVGNRLKWPGLLLGFSLGGFFDGILLHQILQWHHLLSNVSVVRDMRIQIMADGLFHALMYVIAGVALYKLWRARASFDNPGASRLLWGNTLAGFGSWHIVDGVLSHWVTAIHRIKIDSPNPLLWDLLWFFAFGVLPVVLGWLMLHKASGGDDDQGQGRVAAASLALAALIAGPIAALPSADTSQVMVLFAPGVSSSAAFNALTKVDARVLWTDRSGGTWAVTMADPSAAWQLYRHGAMLVSNSAMSFGCFSWTKTGKNGI